MVRASKEARPRALMFLAMGLAAFSVFASVPQTLLVSAPDERFFFQLIQYRADVLYMLIPLVVSLVAVLSSALLGKPRKRADLLTAGGIAFCAVLLAVLLQWIGFETFSIFFLKLAAFIIALSMTVLWKFFPVSRSFEKTIVSVLDPASTATSAGHR